MGYVLKRGTVHPRWRPGTRPRTAKKPFQLLVLHSEAVVCAAFGILPVLCTPHLNLNTFPLANLPFEASVFKSTCFASWAAPPCLRGRARRASHLWPPPQMFCGTEACASTMDKQATRAVTLPAAPERIPKIDLNSGMRSLSWTPSATLNVVSLGCVVLPGFV